MSSLREDILPIPVAGGIDSKVQDFLRNPPAFRTLVNMRHRRAGALEARPSFETLGSVGDEPVAGQRYFDVNTVITREDVRTYSAVANGGLQPWSPAARDGTGPYVLNTRRVLESGFGSGNGFVASHGGTVCFVWTTTAVDEGLGTVTQRVYYSIQDAETEALIVPPTVVQGLAASSDIAVAPVTGSGSSTRFYAIMSTNAGGDLAIATVLHDRVSAPAVAAVVTAGGFITSDTALWAQEDGGGNELLVAYNTSVGATVVQLIVNSGGLLLPGSGPSTPGTGVNEMWLREVKRFSSGRLALIGIEKSTEDGIVFWTDGSLTSPSWTRVVWLDVSTEAGGLVGTETNAVSIVELGTSGYMICWESSLGPSGPIDISRPGSVMPVGQGEPTATPTSSISRAGAVNWRELGTDAFGAAGTIYSAASVRLHGHVFSLRDEPTIVGKGRVVAPLVGIPNHMAQACGFLLELTLEPRGRLVAQYQADIAVPVADTEFFPKLSRTPPLGSGVVFAALVEERESAGAGSLLVGQSARAVRGVEVQLSNHVGLGLANDVLTYGAGAVCGFDGVTAADLTMPGPAVAVFADPVDNPTNVFNIAQGTWTYRFVWRWQDYRGNVHRSGFSEVQLPATDGNEFAAPETNVVSRRVRVFAPAPTHWGEDSGTTLFLEVYQSPGRQTAGQVEANGDVNVFDGVFVRRQVLEWQVDPAQPWWSLERQDLITPLRNTDARRATEIDLYTNDGEGGSGLQALVPPSPLDLAVTDRIVVIDAEDRRRAPYSTPLVQGVAPFFNPANQITIPSEIGQGTAIGTLHGYPVVFTERSVNLVRGSFGDAFGQNESLTLQQLSADIGCSNPSSVIETEAGLFFESEAGIYLLQRNLQMLHIGAPVEGAITGLDIRDTTVYPARKQVVFLTPGINGLVEAYIYDYEARAWLTYALATELGGNGGAVAFVGDQERLVAASQAGLIAREGEVESGMGGALSASFETAWIKLNALEGFGRVWEIRVVGKAIGVDTNSRAPGTLTIRPYYDYNETPPPVPYVIDLRAEAERLNGPGSTSLDPMRLRVPLATQLCSSIRFDFLYEPGNTSEACNFEIAGIELVVGRWRNAAPLAFPTINAS